MTPFAFSSHNLILFVPDALRVFLGIWLFAVGGCVGSFLNVVVLRMPAGIGIARTGSRCPVCLHSIRWYDNIPILSWLLLRGRCRDCGTSISIRYPLVEFLVAVMFVLLGLVEVLRAGSNLPLPVDAGRYFRFEPTATWSLFTFHIAAIVTLLGAALIERDRHAVPLRLLIPVLATGWLAAACFRFLHPVPATARAIDPTWLTGLVNASCGLVVGALLGAAASPAAARQPWRPAASRTAFLASAIVGVFAGWQAACIVVVAAAAAFGFASFAGCVFSRMSRGPWLIYLVAALYVFLWYWRPLVEHFEGLGAGGAWWLAPGAVTATLTISLLTAWLAPAREFIQRAAMEDLRMAEPFDREKNLRAILDSPSYLPVEYDSEFLQQWETRPVRVQLELLKTENALMREGVESTIVVFGGTQVVEAQEAESRLQAARAALEASPNDPQARRSVERLTQVVAKSHYYDAAREFGKLVSSNCQIDGKCDYVIVTGGGPGIMEAANRGAYEVGAKSIGLNITLPAEQAPNPYITPELCFQFHYFALRKMHFLMRAKAMIVFPGGFGTLDELFDALTLRQTKRMQEIPIILFGREFWEKAIDFQFLADEGVVADRDLELINFVQTADEAWELIVRFHNERV